MSARIFFAGAVVGAIVGALAVVALQKEGASTPVAENSTTATVREETTSRSDTSPALAPVNVVQSAADPSVPAAARSGSTANVTTTSSDPGLPAPGSTADVAPPSSSDPGDEVIRTDAEMRARGESMEQLSDKMKSEARDDAWAPNMENELRDFLARRPVPNALGTTSVECRSTVCRIVSVVNDQVNAAMPGTDLQGALASLPHESLGREVVFISLAMGADSKRPDQLIEVAFLRRADKSSNSAR
ncbi:MAG TPA: hypothetical protein VJT10_23180 [Steroidobacteraceae bacterium]|nr:hypothetical protein [Steroidobacteraceae bacterium]